MAKINIDFDNTNYPIDDSAIASATAQLQSHLSTVMSGTGATINLGGTTYNVDSTKLSAATTAFVSHLGTVSGSGMKVMVNGVEYGIDSTKMSSAIADLHKVLGGLQSGGSEGEVSYEVILPEGEYNFVSNPVLGTYNSVEADWFTLEEGETYRVIWDGEEFFTKAYACTFNGNELIAIGNEGYMKGESAEFVEPFCIYRVLSNNYCFLATFTEEDSHTVAIYKVVNGNGSNDIMIFGEYEFVSTNISFGLGVDIDVSTDFQLVPDETYKVCFDGVNYNCTALDASDRVEGYVVLGNASDYGFPSNGEPFGICFASLDGGMSIVCWEDTQPTKHTITIYKVVNGSINTNIEVDIFPRETLTFKPYSNDTEGICQIEPTIFTIKAGETYFVEWDGITYTCVGRLMFDFGEGVETYGIGNLSLSATELEDTGEPFAILSFWNNENSHGNVFFSTDPYATSHTVRVYQVVNSSTDSELNEYGFYFDKIYSTTFTEEDTGDVFKITKVFHEDGSCEDVSYINGEEDFSTTEPAGTYTYGDHVIFMDGEEYFTVNEDGTQLTTMLNGDRLVFILIGEAILAETTYDGFAFNEIFGTYVYNVNPSPFELTLGETYRVWWDGIEYECVAQDISAVPGNIGLGNLSSMGGIGNGEPFAIGYKPTTDTASGVSYLASNTATSHTVAIYK